MRYEILGPLRIVNHDSALFVTAPKMASVLATMLIQFDWVVPCNQLISEVWGTEPPNRAVATLHVYISQLRKFLKSADESRDPIVTQQPGYLLSLGGDDLDYQIFLRLLADGRSHLRAERYEQALAACEAALRLCRGPALAGLREGVIVKGFVTWLKEERLSCVKMVASCLLNLGRHDESIGLLQDQITKNPLHEDLYQQLMSAFFLAGRRADALDAYRLARTTLIDELGLEPRQTLKDLQRFILESDADRTAERFAQHVLNPLQVMEPHRLAAHRVGVRGGSPR